MQNVLCPCNSALQCKRVDEWRTMRVNENDGDIYPVSIARMVRLTLPLRFLPQSRTVQNEPAALDAYFRKAGK
jgi:hypothetical protein